MAMKITKIVLLCIILFASFSMSAFFVFADANATSCGVVNNNLTLAANINISLNSGESCFTINKSNIVLNGAGVAVAGNHSGFGVYALNKQNVTIKNMKLRSFDAHIFIENSTNVSIHAADITRTNSSPLAINDKGIKILNSHRGNITDSTINFDVRPTSDANFDGIILINSTFNLIKSNTITLGVGADGGSYGIRFENSSENNNIKNRINIWEVGGGNPLVVGVAMHAGSHGNNNAENYVYIESGTNNRVGFIVSNSSYTKSTKNLVNNVEGTDIVGIILKNGASNNNFTNDIVSRDVFGNEAIGDKPVFVEGAGTNNIFTNLTFNKNKINFSSTNPVGMVEIRWYVDVLVNATSGVVENALITVANGSGQTIDTAITDDFGRTQHALTEFIKNATETRYMTTHNLTAARGGFYKDSKVINLTATNSTSVLLNASSIEVDVHNTSKMYSNSTFYSVLHFIVKNIGPIAPLFNWGIDNGQNDIESTLQTNLTQNETIFIFVEHQYGAAGTYTLTANASTGSDFDKEEKGISVI